MDESNRLKERRIAEAAARALAEAQARKRAAQARKREAPPAPLELGGRDGPEPTRYGDWEKDGILSDF